MKPANRTSRQTWGLLATLAVCLTIFIVRCERAISRTSPTFDEGVHLTAGYSYWRTGDFRMNRETPPFMKLIWALPLLAADRPPFQPDAEQWARNDIWRMADAFLYESPVSFEAMLNPARRMNVAIGAILVGLVGWWALRAWGPASGVTAWVLAALDPNLIAQSAVLSTDVGLGLFCTMAAYASWEYAGNPKRGWFILAGISLGLALATKFSAGVAVIGLASGAIASVLAGGTFALPGVAIAGRRPDRLKQAFSAFVRLGIIAAITILPAYFVIRGLDWPRGLRQQLGRNEFAEPHYFLNGEISSSGWMWYFVEVLAHKTPWGTLALALIGSLTLRRSTRRDMAFVVVPAVVFFLAMSVARLNIGLRVVLPAYPLMWMLAARVSSLGSNRLVRVVVLLACLLPPIFDWDRHGRDLSYFNGIIAGRADGHKYLGDSNIDWGQGLGSLSTELHGHGNPVIFLSYAGTGRPEAFGIRFERLPGWGEFRPPPADRVDRNGRILVAVSVSNLQGTYLDDPIRYRWLFEREPLSKTDGSIWVFDVTGDADALRRLDAK